MLLLFKTNFTNPRTQSDEQNFLFFICYSELSNCFLFAIASQALATFCKLYPKVFYATAVHRHQWQESFFHFLCAHRPNFHKDLCNSFCHQRMTIISFGSFDCAPHASQFYCSHLPNFPSLTNIWTIFINLQVFHYAYIFICYCSNLTVHDCDLSFWLMAGFVFKFTYYFLLACYSCIKVGTFFCKKKGLLMVYCG